MIEYTEFKENMKNHKKLWTMISELPQSAYEDIFNIEALKSRVIRTNGMPIPKRGYCYLCNIDCENMSSGEKICQKCPCIENKLDGKSIKCLDGKYANAARLFHNGQYEAFQKVAKEIAELPIINPIYAEYAKRMEHENELD